MNTATWVKIHGYVSMFFFPLALIYAITGALVIFNQYGTLNKEKHQIQIDHELLSNVNVQKILVSDFLAKAGEKLPVGEPRLSRGEFYWGRPSSLNVSIEKGSEDGTAILHVRKPDLLFSLVMLHKAKGGRLFDYFGFIFAISMIFMYVSGIFIFWRIKSKRYALSMTFFAGSVITLLVIYLSL
ncbi:MAG: hypothetical protein Kow0029_32110 [Candidatus Rifleibacteriota bacterium]